METRPAACYRDWGCREGLSDDSKRASCEAVFACGGNGTHPAPGCTAPCFQNESGLIPQVGEPRGREREGDMTMELLSRDCATI